MTAKKSMNNSRYSKAHKEKSKPDVFWEKVYSDELVSSRQTRRWKERQKKKEDHKQRTETTNES